MLRAPREAQARGAVGTVLRGFYHCETHRSGVEDVAEVVDDACHRASECVHLAAPRDGCFGTLALFGAFAHAFFQRVVQLLERALAIGQFGHRDATRVFCSLAFDGDTEQLGQRQQKADIVVVKTPYVGGIRLQHAPHGPRGRDWHVHQRQHSVFAQERRIVVMRVRGQVVDGDRLRSIECSSGGRTEAAWQRRVSDHARFPPDAVGDYQRRTCGLKNFGAFYRKSLDDRANGAVQQPVQGRTVQRIRSEANDEIEAGRYCFKRRRRHAQSRNGERRAYVHRGGIAVRAISNRG